MPHFRKLFDERFVGSWDLEGRDSATVTINAIKMEKLKDTKGSETNKPVLFFTKGKKGLVLNKTNAKQIAEMYGTDTNKWIGKSIVLFATTCEAFGKMVECIRVRNQKPGKGAAAAQSEPIEPERSGPPESPGPSAADDQELMDIT